jgi:hypothetical protein
MARPRKPIKPVQLHLLDRRPAKHRVWDAIPSEVRDEVKHLVKAMLQRHIERGSP